METVASIGVILFVVVSVVKMCRTCARVANAQRQ